jgi:hypothetical protein
MAAGADWIVLVPGFDAEARPLRAAAAGAGFPTPSKCCRGAEADPVSDRCTACATRSRPPPPWTFRPPAISTGHGGKMLPSNQDQR